MLLNDGPDISSEVVFGDVVKAVDKIAIHNLEVLWSKY